MRFPSLPALRENTRYFAALLAIAAVMLTAFFLGQEIITILGRQYAPIISRDLLYVGDQLEPYLWVFNLASFIVSSIVIFLFAKERILVDRYVYFILAAYLLYFPIAGIDWSSFSPVILFPGLFLTGFYLYLRESRLLAMPFLMAAAMTYPVYTFFVVIAGVALLINDRMNGVSGKVNGIPILMILYSFTMLFTQDLGTGLMFHSQSVSLNAYGPLLGIVQDITFSKPIFFILLLVPLITFAFFGPRVLPVSIPYYIFGIAVTAAGSTPVTLLVILNLVMPLAFLGSISWVAKKVDEGLPADDNKIIRYALFSLILMNILVILTYFPFLSILGKLLGI